MTLSDHKNEPTADESAEIAIRYLDIARTIALSKPERAADMLADYFGDNPEAHSQRLWFFAAVGPILAAAACRKLYADMLQPDDFWIIEQLDGQIDADDPDTLAAIQAVVAHLNNDPEAAQDVTSAHFDVVAKKSGHNAAHDAMFSMVVEQMKLLAFLVKEGAFGDLGDEP